MRLFIAINFNSEIKDSLCQTIEQLKSHSLRGNFTARDNLHLTLAFIGETIRSKAVMQAMDGVDGKPFTLTIGGFGAFGRLYWYGVQPNGALSALQRQLCEKLESAGFPLEKREYRPHLTLGREVVLAKTSTGTHLPGRLPNGGARFQISLMKSERLGEN
jgi:2'-5' RNA ligase